MSIALFTAVAATTALSDVKLTSRTRENFTVCASNASCTAWLIQRAFADE